MVAHKPLLEASHANPPFTVFTLNVWFDFFARQTRNLEILALLRQHQPTVICLQEVLNDLVTLLKDDPWVRQNYLISSRSLPSYACMMLLSIPHCLSPTLERTELHSGMNRELLTATFSLPTPAAPSPASRIMVTTSHFESLSFRDVRRHQLSTFRQRFEHFLSTAQPPALAVLCGDFNFCSYRAWSAEDTRPLENHVLTEVLPEFADLWPLLHGGLQAPRLHPPEDAEERARMGYTFDTDMNRNIGHCNPEFMRYDRVLAFFSPHASWKADSIELTANKPCRQVIQEKKVPFGFSLKHHLASLFGATDSSSSNATTPMDEVIFPSDHFGLFVNFSC